MVTSFDSTPPAAASLAALPARLLPGRVQRLLLDRVLNRAFRRPLDEDALDFLEGMTVRIRVLDLDLDWLLTLRSGAIVALESSRQADVCISGDALPFMLLATRCTDSDTLFFQRRLRVEGDTDLGLAVKNTMDGLDWDDLPPPLSRVLQFAGSLLARFQPLAPTRPNART